MKFFVMYAETCVEDYAVPGEEIFQLERACLTSEFQFLDKSPLAVELSDEGGLHFPDFILRGAIPLVSSAVKRVLERCAVDYVFFKPVQLTVTELGRAENFWLALPPRINCLDWERSVFDTEENEFLPPSELIREAKKFFIDENKIGRYNIFKLAGVVNQDIIVTEKLKDALEDARLENIFFCETEE